MNSSYLIEKIDTTTKTLTVHNAIGCVGQKGFRACGANDKEIGVYQTPEIGVAA
jgi:hypothetical protein